MPTHIVNDLPVIMLRNSSANYETELLKKISKYGRISEVYCNQQITVTFDVYVSNGQRFEVQRRLSVQGDCFLNILKTIENYLITPVSITQ